MTPEEREARKAELRQRFEASHARNAAFVAGKTEAELVSEVCDEVDRVRAARLEQTSSGEGESAGTNNPGKPSAALVRVVIDTCVLVRALLAPGAAQGVFTAVFDGKLIPLYDPRLFTEYRDMPGRPKFRGRILVEDVEFLIAQTRAFGEYAWGTGVRLPVPARDPKDTHILELAVAGRADVVITDDTRGFPLGAYPFEYLSPGAVLRRLGLGVLLRSWHRLTGVTRRTW